MYAKLLKNYKPNICCEQASPLILRILNSNQHIYLILYDNRYIHNLKSKRDNFKIKPINQSNNKSRLLSLAMIICETSLFSLLHHSVLILLDCSSVIIHCISKNVSMRA